MNSGKELLSFTDKFKDSSSKFAITSLFLPPYIPPRFPFAHSVLRDVLSSAGVQAEGDCAVTSGAYLRHQHGGEEHGLPHVCGSGGWEEGGSHAHEARFAPPPQKMEIALVRFEIYRTAV